MITLPRIVTKEVIQQMAMPYIEQVEYGEVDPLSMYIKLEGLLKAISLIKEAIKKEAISNADEYTLREDRRMHAVEFSIRTGRTTFDYSEDREWRKLRHKEKEAGLIRKEREIELKKIYNTPDPETGEIQGDITIKTMTKATLALTIPDK